VPRFPVCIEVWMPIRYGSYVLPMESFICKILILCGTFWQLSLFLRHDFESTICVFGTLSIGSTELCAIVLACVFVLSEVLVLLQASCVC